MDRKQGIIYGPDRIGVVGFHDDPFVIAKPAYPHQPWLQQRILTLHTRTGTMTNMAGGLRLGVQLAKKTPRGVLRRIWLLSDGHPNIDTDQIGKYVQEARQNWININCIGIGDNYNRALLEKIAGSTHNGKFIHVNTLKDMTNTLIRFGGRNGARHRSETTIMVIDMSDSMKSGRMGDKSRIAVVEEALMKLLFYKQQMFA